MVVVNIQQIGDVQFVKSAAARYIRITVNKFGEVRVTVPEKAAIEYAVDFVEKKNDWIIKAKKQAERRKTIFTPDTVFSTQSRQLQLLSWKSENFRAQMSKDALKIFYPYDVDIQSDKAQEIICNYITDAIREEAKEYLPQRTKQLAVEHGFSYSSVAVKNVSSRWGSCSSQNRINLSIHLVRLPQHLSDYVILHELTHTVHKNHAPIFWRHLDKITNYKAKQLAKELKLYDVEINKNSR